MTKPTRDVSHCGLAIYIKKYLKAKEEFNEEFNLLKNKNPLKKNQNPSRYYNSITNLKFQHKLKISSFKKNPCIKSDLLLLLLLLLLPRGQNPFSYYTL